jgi:hypothetical protein
MAILDPPRWTVVRASLRGWNVATRTSTPVAASVGPVIASIGAVIRAS